ncbi:hypothetical protein GQ602_006229 [Ophiocordyceps camponoti-floridani]|uniref:DNA damage-responsive protein 48 n=1 Tax=Ophiocordyceps camponoti-floridani TaxID=2030778 RepID=A0A8H4Q2U7_9HYPO|nr:hypothetical protein GQ602_006229 [Ophiocordyceps camponoti-floridani]
MSFMHNISKAIGKDVENEQNNESSSSLSAGQGGQGFMDKVNNMAGGGQRGEENEDALDKAVDMFQEKVLGQGDQSNESAAEQAKDEAISDYIRDKYKSTTGSDFPIKDKEKKLGL